MTESVEMQFDHEKLDVYQLSVEFNRLIALIAPALREVNRHLRDQLGRAALSIPLNIAEGNGKRSPADRRRFLEIARGSAMECAACLDVWAAVGAHEKVELDRCKTLLLRIVAMLSKMTAIPGNSVREEDAEYE